MEAKRSAYALLRAALGVNLLLHGFIRILHGAGAFAAATAQHLASTGSPLPHSFLYAYSFGIPFVEVLLGLLLIAGLWTRQTLILGSLFLMSLTAGSALSQLWDAAGQQLIYQLVLFALLFLLEWNFYSLDAVRVARLRGTQ